MDLDAEETDDSGVKVGQVEVLGPLIQFVTIYVIGT